MAAAKKPAAKKAAAESGAFESIESIVARINREQNDPNLIVFGTQLRKDIPRITSGLLSFDIRSGGGWARGQWNEVIGRESNGKTAVVMKTVAANQAVDPNFKCLWIASEEFVEPYAEAIGIDMSRIVIVNTNEMELAYTVVIDAMRNRAVDLVVIDSYPALVPTSEDEAEMADWQVGLGARLMGKFMRKSTKAGKRSLVDEDDRPCTGIVINQWRDQIGGFSPHGTPKTTPGGNAKNYHYFIRAEVKRDEFLSQGKTVVGQSVAITTVKNKTAPPRQTAKVDFYFKDSPKDGMRFGEFDVTRMVVIEAVEAGVITKKGAWYYFGDQLIGQGEDQAVAYLRVRPKLYKEIHDTTFSVLLPTMPVPPCVPPVVINDDGEIVVEDESEPEEPKKVGRTKPLKKTAPAKKAPARKR